MPHRLTGSRIDDPPPASQPFMFRLELAVRKYPVQLALVLMFVVVSIPIYMLLNSNSDLRHSNTQLRNALVSTQTSRVATLSTFCKVINHNAKTANTQTDYLKQIIVGGAKSSRAFEHVFRELGLPPYKVRLRLARQQASGLDRVKLPALKCQKFVHSANQQIKELNKGR